MGLFSLFIYKHCSFVAVANGVFKSHFNYFNHINFFRGHNSPSGLGPPHYHGFTLTLRHISLGRTLLNEWSARRTDLYLTIYATLIRERERSIPPAGFEPTVPESERPQTHTVDRAATGFSHINYYRNKFDTATWIYYKNWDLKY
jgi:hypothetical protein